MRDADKLSVGTRERGNKWAEKKNVKVIIFLNKGKNEYDGRETSERTFIGR